MVYSVSIKFSSNFHHAYPKSPILPKNFGSVNLNLSPTARFWLILFSNCLSQSPFLAYATRSRALTCSALLKFLCELYSVWLTWEHSASDFRLIEPPRVDLRRSILRVRDSRRLVFTTALLYSDVTSPATRSVACLDVMWQGVKNRDQVNQCCLGWKYDKFDALSSS